MIYHRVATCRLRLKSQSSSKHTTSLSQIDILTTENIAAVFNSMAFLVRSPDIPTRIFSDSNSSVSHAFTRRKVTVSARDSSSFKIQESRLYAKFSAPAKEDCKISRHDEEEEDKESDDDSRPIVLVTNGDGIDSPGLVSLVEALVREGLYNVHVCAPQTCVRSLIPPLLVIFLFKVSNFW